MDWLASPEAWIALLTLTILEVVLGIDNLIFISILSGKLPPEQQPKARRLGLGLALITRILLLIGIAWVAKLNRPFWEADLFGFHLALSWRDVVLIAGGLFLLATAKRSAGSRPPS
jgi:predicted tellurium resistance membrane protein TerC